jgi:hypothetical protein
VYGLATQPEFTGVKEIQKPMYEAVDGQTFDAMKACAEHEIALLDKLLHSVAPDDIREALKRRGFSIRSDRSAPRETLAKIAARPGAEKTERADA